jgi:hypothetical protein
MGYEEYLQKQQARNSLLVVSADIKQQLNSSKLQILS